MSEMINFIVNTKDFKSVKKMKVIDAIKKKDILEFLASIEVSTNTQIFKKLKEIIDLESFQESINSYLTKDLSFLIKEINSNGFEKIVDSKLKTEYKKNIKEILSFLRSHVLNFYLLENNFLDEDSVGYYKILYPTRKKILKKAIKK